MRREAPWLLLLLIVPSIAIADEPQETTEETAGPEESGLTERVEVRTTAPVETDVAAFATRIDTDDLARRGMDLADALRRVPGVRIRDYGGLGSYATMSLRASTSEQVTVLVDGVPQNRALGGPVDLSSIPATQVRDVTVFRGFAPAAYGLGGIGGVVDVRTRAPSDGIRTDLDLLAGQLGTARLSGDVSVGTGSASHLRVGLEWLESEGDFFYLDTGETLFNRADDAVRQRENNDVRQRSIMVQHVREQLGGGEFRVGLRLQDRERGVPGLGTLRSSSTRLDEGLQTLNAAWTRAYGGTLEVLDLQVDGFGQELTLADLDGQVGLRVQDQTTNLAGGGGAALVRTRFGAHRALFRIDLRHERARVTDRTRTESDLGGANRDLTGFTAEDMWTVGPLTIAPSVRWQYVRDTFSETGEPTLTAPAWSGKLGLAWALGPASSIRGSLGRFHRVPSLMELFGDRGVIVGNSDLLPESGLVAELGYGFQRRTARVPWSTEWVGFARRSENLIRFVPVSQGAAVARNLAEVESYGLEASLAIQPARGLDIDATGSVQQARDLSWGAGRRLPYQPDLLGYLGMAYSVGRLRARWETTYTGENSTDTLDTPELRLPARVLHDASLEWDAGAGFAVGLEVRNVFDRQTRDLLRYPLPGRVVFVHVGWRNGVER